MRYKRLLRMAIILLSAIALATITMILSYQVSAPGYHARIGRNIEVLSWRSDFYPSVIPGRNFSRLDNYTDAIMAQLAMDNPRLSVRENALNPRMVLGPIDEMRGLPNQVEGLKARYYLGAEPDYGYGRYWNGYVGFIRALGSIFDFQQLRVVNYLVLGSFMILACYSIQRLFDRHFMYAFVVSLFATSIYFVPLSLQYLSCFYLMLAGVIALCWLLDKQGKGAPVIELFCLSAIATAYLDLFTAPLVVVGSLSIVYALWLYRDRRNSGCEVMKRLLVPGLSWWAAYAAFWAAKPLVAQLFGVKGVGDATGTQFLKHFLDPTTNDWLHAIPYNLATLMGASSMDVSIKGISYWLYVLAFFVLLASSMVVWIWLLKRRQEGVLKLRMTRRYLPLLAVAVTPFLWWQITPWHAANHPFVYREVAVFLFGVAAFYLLTLYEANRKEEARYA